MSEMGPEVFSNQPNNNEAALREIMDRRLARIKEIDDRIAALNEERKAYLSATGGDSNSIEISGKDTANVEKTVLIDSRDPAVLLTNSLEGQRPGVIIAEEKLNEAQNPQS
jgi:hypothetical protein